LSPVEFAFSTPSHHQVHHGSDPIHLDRNYAASWSSVSIAESLATGREAEISSASGVPAAQLTVSVSGQDAGPVPSASLGERSRIRALLHAPHGTLALADRVHATGAFAG
jgi:hypothetical protein